MTKSPILLGSERWSHKLVCFALPLLPSAALLPGCQPKPQKTLHSELRPFQVGSLLDIAENADATSPGPSCSYGFHAMKDDRIGLVAAVHCTNFDYDYIGEFTVTGERIWQPFDINNDSPAIARIAVKPKLMLYSQDDECREAIDALGPDGSYIFACLVADAAFAPFVDQGIENDHNMYERGAVANLPLSVSQTRLGPVSEKDPDKFTGYISRPVAETAIYKIGATTGKTESVLASSTSGNFIGRVYTGEEILNLGVYVSISENDARVVGAGDSGGGVFHPTISGGSGGDFNLVGLAIGQTDVENDNGQQLILLVIEPLGDVLSELGIEVEHAGDGGSLSFPQ